MAGKKYKKVIILLPILVLLVVCGIGVYIYIDQLAYKICRVEAGVYIKASDFVKNGDSEAIFTERSEVFDISVPGEYQVEVKSGWFSHKAKLYIEDTIAPSAMRDRGRTYRPRR